MIEWKAWDILGKALTALHDRNKYKEKKVFTKYIRLAITMAGLKRIHAEFHSKLDINSKLQMLEVIVKVIGTAYSSQHNINSKSL